MALTGLAGPSNENKVVKLTETCNARLPEVSAHLSGCHRISAVRSFLGVDREIDR